jgi:hypothetical protein
MKHDVLRLSLVVDDELFWLPSFDDGESQDAEPSQRRRQQSATSRLTTTSAARRCVHAGRDGTVTGNRIAPVRSSSAVLVSSQNQNREWIYSQQQTVSAEGYSGQTFNTHVPHTGARD